jgi:hypothetical protein
LGWIQKNNDALVPEIEDLLANSCKQLVRTLAGSETQDPVTGERFTSVSSKYLGNLTDLLSTLHRCRLHYIRCFNPNDKRSPGTFQSKYVLDQIIQCGTVELVNMMHHGYPNRCKLAEIRQHYSNLLPANFERYKDRDFAEAIMLAFEIDKTQWTVGTSRLFLKAGQLRMLEHLRDSGSVASKDMIVKIRRQFLRKKWRAAITAVFVANWFPRHARKLRTLVVLTALRKTCSIYVRIYRWLNRARKVLYGTVPTRRSYALEKPRAPDASYFLLPSMYGAKRLQFANPGRPELFVAINRHENQDEYMGAIQHQIDSQKQVADSLLTIWQKAITENVLFFDGKHLLSTRLDPRMYLSLDVDGAGREASLTDARYVDVSETGLALRHRADLSSSSEIVCMCQHPKHSNRFATCHKSHILIWSWFGTDHDDADKMATMCECGFVRDDDTIVYGMAFLGDVPEGIENDDGHVLLLLSGHPLRPWLTINIVVVYDCAHRIVCTHNIGEDGSFLEAARSGQLTIKLSHSDRVLYVGGRDAALFFEIQRSTSPGPEYGGLSLSLIKDVAKLAEDERLDFVSCLCLAAPKGVGLDWIVLGAADGDLYGFCFVSEAGKMVLSKYHGRFSSKQIKHDRDVPVGTLLATYGSTPHCHHQKIREQGISYTVFLETMERENQRFLSLADNGKLLGWALERHGWTSQVEEGMHAVLERGYSDGCSPRFVAAQCSRLVPHVLVLVDQDLQRISCLDTTKKWERAPMESMCNLGGA